MRPSILVKQVDFPHPLDIKGQSNNSGVPSYRNDLRHSSSTVTNLFWLESGKSKVHHGIGRRIHSGPDGESHRAGPYCSREGEQ